MGNQTKITTIMYVAAFMFWAKLNILRYYLQYAYICIQSLIVREARPPLVLVGGGGGVLLASLVPTPLSSRYSS